MNNIKEMNDPTLQVGDTVRMQYAPKFNYGWISVKDRLPTENRKYLVFCETFITISTFYLDVPEPHFYESEATHWMPLPELPIE